MVIITTGPTRPVQYFQAVQAGKRRAGESQMKLFKIAGFAMLTLTTKKAGGGFAPVGEEDFAAVIRNREGFIAILVDGDGFTKAQTKPMDRDGAAGVFRKLLESGTEEFPGGEVEIWTERYPVIQKDLR